MPPQSSYSYQQRGQKNDSYTSAILQRPCVVNIAELGPSLNIPDFAQAGFGVISNPRFQQQGSSSLSLDDLERNLAIASGWTSNCYRVFSSIAIDLNRQFPPLPSSLARD